MAIDNKAYVGGTYEHPKACDRSVTQLHAEYAGFALADAEMIKDEIFCCAGALDLGQCGILAVNTPKFPGALIPFCGWKLPSLGHEASKRSVAEHLEPKHVCFGIASA
ncbi:acyl-CoA reductase-like NAD-dependent aldehyde dehydrogenase [Bradyrhizobium sp. USDA 4518]